MDAVPLVRRPPASGLTRGGLPPTLKTMEVRLAPELAAKVVQWSAETGQPVNDLIEGAITGYFSEVEQIKATLDSRFDDIESGRVQLVDGEEACRILRARAAARQKSIA
jgi:predicted transcriptional regulator